MHHVLCIYTQMFSVSHIQVVVPVKPKTVEIIQLVHARSVICLCNPTGSQHHAYIHFCTIYSRRYCVVDTDTLFPEPHTVVLSVLSVSHLSVAVARQLPVS